jgi:hypothetical protein
MILLSLLRWKKTLFVRIVWVNKAVISYTYVTNVINNIVEITNKVVVWYCLPSGGKGNLLAYLTNALLKTLVSCTEPGHPATTKVNLISKSQTANTFWVVSRYRPKCAIITEKGTTTWIWVPSIAPLTLGKWGEKHASYSLECTIENCGSFGSILSTVNLFKQFNIWLNFLFMVYVDLSNLFSTCLIDCGSPTIHRNMVKHSIELKPVVDSNP